MFLKQWKKAPSLDYMFSKTGLYQCFLHENFKVPAFNTYMICEWISLLFVNQLFFSVLVIESYVTNHSKFT